MTNNSIILKEFIVLKMHLFHSIIFLFLLHYCFNSLISKFDMISEECFNGLLINKINNNYNLSLTNSYSKCVLDCDIGLIMDSYSVYSSSIINLSNINHLSIELWYYTDDIVYCMFQLINNNSIPILSFGPNIISYYDNVLNLVNEIDINTIFNKYNFHILEISQNNIKVFFNKELQYDLDINFDFKLLDNVVLQLMTNSYYSILHFALYDEILSLNQVEYNYNQGFLPNFPQFNINNKIIGIENTFINITLYYSWINEKNNIPTFNYTEDDFIATIIPPSKGLLYLDDIKIINPINIDLDDIDLMYISPKSQYLDEFNPYINFTISLQHNERIKYYYYDIYILPKVYPPISINSSQNAIYDKDNLIILPYPELHPLSKNIIFRIIHQPLFGIIKLNNRNIIDFSFNDKIMYKTKNIIECDIETLVYDNFIYKIIDVINNVESIEYSVNITVYTLYLLDKLFL